MVFTAAHMRDNTKIFTGSAVQEGGGWGKGKGKGKVKGKVKGMETPPPEQGEEKGDLLIQDLCTQGMDSIHDMLFVNSDAVSYQSKTPEKCIDNAKREKKKKYLNTCFNEHQRFTLFVA